MCLGGVFGAVRGKRTGSWEQQPEAGRGELLGPKRSLVGRGSQGSGRRQHLFATRSSKKSLSLCILPMALDGQGALFSSWARGPSSTFRASNGGQSLPPQPPICPLLRGEGPPPSGWAPGEATCINYFLSYSRENTNSLMTEEQAACNGVRGSQKSRCSTGTKGP
uniref:Uncharacterized protein n=1 Tax=Myotis myotis TaxID=51298 RepID=A0A7J7RGY9_MYOMY|nr:hypothetical protein mMyoMyo1_010309 [Myotis myotis]